jgi:hypothetical protein
VYVLSRHSVLSWHPVLSSRSVQVLAMLLMERPVSMHPDDIRDEKTKVIRSMRVLTNDDVVLGQYTAGNGQPGYRDDDGAALPAHRTSIACSLSVFPAATLPLSAFASKHMAYPVPAHMSTYRLHAMLFLTVSRCCRIM